MPRYGPCGCTASRDTSCPGRIASTSGLASSSRDLRAHHPLPSPTAEQLFSQLPAGMGRPVPREALDPEAVYEPAQAPALLDAFLRSLDWVNNPFLRTASEVEDSDDFDGVPYRYASFSWYPTSNAAVRTDILQVSARVLVIQ